MILRVEGAPTKLQSGHASDNSPLIHATLLELVDQANSLKTDKQSP